MKMAAYSFIILLLFCAVHGEVEEAVPGAYPFTVSLQIKDLGGHTCSGAILSEMWVLSTANCADTDDAIDHNNFLIVAGEWDLNADDGTEQEVHVEKVYRHPYFSADQSCDVALVRLAAPLNLTGSGDAVLLPEAGEEFGGECTEMGWSQLAGKKKMQVGHPQYISTEECQKIPELADNIGFSTFCGISSASNMAEMCPGYTGSPLICPTERGDVLAGFQSYTFACQTVGVPSTYTKLAALRDWIDYILSKYED